MPRVQGRQIKDYFLNYQWRDRDFTMQLKSGKGEPRNGAGMVEDWEITFVETGATTQTGGRLFRTREYVESDTFLFNYCDGLSDVDLDKLVAFHRAKKKIATLTGFHPRSRYGVIRSDDNEIVNYWQEKPMTTDLTNGGFFVLEPKVLRLPRRRRVHPRDRAARAASRRRELALYRARGLLAVHGHVQARAKLLERAVAQAATAPWKVWS